MPHLTSRRFALGAVSRIACLLALVAGSVTAVAQGAAAPPGSRPLARYDVREVNEVPRAESGSLIAIVGATLIDGRGGSPVTDAMVVVRENRIEKVGRRGEVSVPKGARIIEAAGHTVLPGLIDAHFHRQNTDLTSPTLGLRRGVTSLRDPGKWIEDYEGVRKSADPIPRLFLTGPFLDMFPSAHPRNGVMMRDSKEVTAAVNQFVDGGASAIKVYFRLPPALIEAATVAAHARGVPVTGHLELADARLAIEAGMDGIEHVTSLGTALMPPLVAEQYRQSVMTDNNARNEGRLETWSRIDPQGREAGALIDLMVKRRTYLCPTLALFERRPGGPPHTPAYLGGFANMKAFVARAARAGVKIVTGSHAQLSNMPERGWSYQHEMSVLVASGLTPMQVIVASTSECARFLGIDRRLGTVETGKEADLVIVAGDPLADISAMRHVRHVLLNGRVVQ